MNNIVMRHDKAETLLLAGAAALKAGRLSEAARLWGELIELAPPPELLTQAYFNLGYLCVTADNMAMAESCYRQALAADAGNHEAREQLAALLAKAERDEEAMALFALLAEQAPAARHYFNLGLLLSRAGRMDEAEAQYRTGLSVEPDHANTLYNLGALLSDRGLTAESLACLKRALLLAPESAEVFGTRGIVHEAENQLALAEQCLQRALELAPDSPQAHCNLGVLQVDLGQMSAAEATFRALLKLDPDNARGQFYLAHVLLATERYAEGWALHESRFARAGAMGWPLLPPIPVPQWQGESLQGKFVLLRHEQGFGDELQFSRYYPYLKAMGARRVELLCHAALIPLLQSAAGIDAIHDRATWSAESLAADRADYWTTGMSVPHFGHLADPIANLPYLHVPHDRRTQWLARVAKQSRPEGKPLLRVGLLWRGHPQHANDAHRSLSSIEVLAPLWQLASVQYFSLQREIVETTLPLVQFGSAIADFADAGALIECLDLVISVDSAYAHLAGALGHPVWVMLPARNTDWRWQRDCSDTPWYPRCMHLFRQHERGHWAPVLDEIVAALAALAESRQGQGA